MFQSVPITQPVQNPQLTHRSHGFSSNTWTTSIVKYHKDGVYATGGDLLWKLFTKHELETQTPSGRKTPNFKQHEQLDIKRQNQLLGMYMHK